MRDPPPDLCPGSSEKERRVVKAEVGGSSPSLGTGSPVAPQVKREPTASGLKLRVSATRSGVGPNHTGPIL